MDTIPIEILSTILQQSLEPCALSNPEAFPRRLHFLSRLCLVSKFWNDTVRSTPELWSVIQVNFAYADKDLVAAELQIKRGMEILQRVGNWPIDIILLINVRVLANRMQCRAFWKIWDELMDRSQQWRSLQIGSVVLQRRTDLNRLLPFILPNLLEADIGTDIHFPNPNIFASRLTHLDCSRHSGEVLFLTRALRYIHMSGPTSYITDVLSYSPVLEVLKITSGIDDIPVVKSRGKKINLPRLRVLEATGRTTYLGNFLPCLDAPSLETISLLEVPAGTAPPGDPSTTPLAFPSLTTLEYGSLKLDLGPLRDFMSLLTPKPKSVRLSAKTMSIPRDIDSGSFNTVDAHLRWIEETGCTVVWTDTDAVPETCFKSVEEAREYARASTLWKLFAQLGVLRR